ncbi:MAG: DoxX family protein [Proteobacteria bacterium]|nr:DoxX family protein [Pseudomonadota bacterium]
MALSKLLLQFRFVKAYLIALYFLEKYIGGLLFLTIRVWMARIFWDSGVCKAQSWPNTLMLFKYEYKVPVISPDLAAYLATITELTCPILLVIGFASRLAAIPMLIMTAVIQCTYLCLNEHLYWAMLLGLIVCFGPGLFSADFLFRKWVLQK